MRFNQVYQYNFPTTIRFGAGVVKELAGYCQQHQLKTPLLVTDPIISQLSFFQKHCCRSGTSAYQPPDFF
ncbi:MAG: hypothetical protein NVV59_16870 [Chitinophagaceae bacterium]|nr:hypothetical protein [Chitinophagaceae bacterium]